MKDTNEFEKEFYELCKKYNMRGAFIHCTFSSVEKKIQDEEMMVIDWYCMGHKLTCDLFNSVLKRAYNDEKK